MFLLLSRTRLHSEPEREREAGATTARWAGALGQLSALPRDQVAFLVLEPERPPPRLVPPDFWEGPTCTDLQQTCIPFSVS